MVGRPSKYEPIRVERILSALRDGNTRRAAAACGGIDEDTLIRWQHRYVDFADAVRRAETDGEVSHVANIAKQSRDDWRASAWWLERRRNADFGKVDRLEIMIREQAEKLAAEEGLDAAEMVALAGRIVGADRGA